MECARPRPEWIWCDDFEEDRLGKYFEYLSRGGAFTREPGAGYGLSVGMRARYRKGQADAGALHLAFGTVPSPRFRPVDGGTRTYREIWWRFRVRYAPGWQGGGGGKLTRATAFATESWAQAMIAHVWSAGPAKAHLAVDPATGIAGGNLTTARYNDFAKLRWLGAAVSGTAFLRPGVWRCVEVHVRLNRPGARDGEMQLWVDGRLEADRTGLDWVGEWPGGVNAVFLENWWDGGAPTQQDRFFDDFVVSTGPVGC